MKKHVIVVSGVMAGKSLLSRISLSELVALGVVILEPVTDTTSKDGRGVRVIVEEFAHFDPAAFNRLPKRRAPVAQWKENQRRHNRNKP